MPELNEQWLEHLSDATVALIAQPLTFSRTLMMVGYEPLPPTLVSPLFPFLYTEKKFLMRPNIFKYARALRYEIGLFNIFTVGYPASLIQKYIKTYVTDRVLSIRHQDVHAKKSYIVSDLGITHCFKEAFHLANARIAGVVVSYPFNVIAIRQMVEAVQSGGSSSTLFTHFFDILNNEGILSLFNGIIPRIAEEAVTVYSVAFFVYILNNYVFPEHSDQQMRQYAPIVAGFTVSTITHPLAVIAATMALSGAGLDLVRSYSNSVECYSSLKKSNQLDRGMSTFFRYVSNGPL